ncbi:MAG: glycosyltransferase family 4 protein [Pseudohongiellaceae bacterium]|nr:glycosyltransferase family 4 protein [Pseudohongiellaceae bacterium]
MALFILLALSFLFSLAITFAMGNIASRARLTAIENERSSHTGSVPVGGGLGFVLVYFVSICALWGLGSLSLSHAIVLFSAIPVAIVGLFDDKSHVDFRLRLGVQTFCALVAAFFVGRLPAIDFAFFSLPLTGVGLVLVPMAFLWLTNLYNFMDGIDGIAAGQACIACLGAAVIFLQHNNGTLALLCLLMFAAYLGFLVLNWHPARIFMGDIGSGFSGFMFGAVALIGHATHTMSLWSWILLLGIFIVDATVTLLRRWRSGQRLYEAHRSHVYQHLALKYGSHSAVVWRLSLINVIYLMPLALLAGKLPEYGVYFASAGLLPLVLVAIKLGAGLPSTRTAQ